MNQETECAIPHEQWSTVSLAEAGRPIGRRQVQLWALVLEAQAIQYRIEPDGKGWQLQVPLEYCAKAQSELRLFEEQNRNWPPAVLHSTPLVHNPLATLSVLFLLAIFHNLIQLEVYLPGQFPPDWAALGNAQAGAIRAGEWWRLITALTLHADWVHLASNLAIGGIFIMFLCSEIGSGLAWTLLITAGSLGNLANAWVQSPEHASLGASTGVFAAVGSLAACNMIRRRRLVQRRWLLPVSSALALLALLGTEGANTDLGAHLFGFLAGFLLGLGTECLLSKTGTPSSAFNAALSLISAGVVLFSWWLALTVVN